MNPVYGADRFPRPDFDGGHILPKVQQPAAHSLFMEYFDVLLLLAALVFASWLALKKRSRKGLFFLTLFSIAYFGFIRKGCVCSVGSLQNVVLSFFDSAYTVPFSVALFFLLPLVFALFFGRTFCSSVCPLGAIQDVVILKPQKLPRWLSKTLGIFPYFYLGFAALFAATGAGFIICRFDPFVSFFRLSGHPPIFILGILFLVVGMFIARPYCRFFCPYGVLLNWLSRFSAKHLSITPSSCIQCRLCEDSCPFDAIQKPQQFKPETNNKNGRRRFTWLVIFTPLVMLIGGWTFSRLSLPLSTVHPRVKLARQLFTEEKTGIKQGGLELYAFKSSGTSKAALYKEVYKIQSRFRFGGWLLGIFLGIVFMIKMIGYSRHKSRRDYEPDRGNCLSCGRCMEYCPQKSDERN